MEDYINKPKKTRDRWDYPQYCLGCHVFVASDFCICPKCGEGENNLIDGYPDTKPEYRQTG